MGVKSKGTPMSRTHISPISGPNALHPDRMTAHERRTELYGLLAEAVVRLKARDRDHLAQNTADSSLHFPFEQSGTATPTQRRFA